MLSMAATIAYFVLSLSNLLLSDAYAVVAKKPCPI